MHQGRAEALSPIEDPRVVLVTGASSGIGLATALQSSARGDVVVLAARGLGPLEDAARQCREAGAHTAMVVQVDVQDDKAVRAVVDEIVLEHGRIDAVVHSAGVVAYGRFEDVPTEVFDRVIATNVLGSANVARAVLPAMRERNQGTVILLGSLIGHIASPFMSAYAVSKWAVRELGRELQIENRDRAGVNISVVSPGGVDTPIYLQAANYLGHVGRPPFPVVTPERVARVIMRTLDSPRKRVPVGPANRFIAVGFTAFPDVFDAIVTPLFMIGATDESTPIEPGTGNVLASSPDGDRLRGEQGSSVVSIAGALRMRAGSALGRLRG